VCSPMGSQGYVRRRGLLEGLRCKGYPDGLLMEGYPRECTLCVSHGEVLLRGPRRGPVEGV
jgi:hypothetical protein